MVSKVSNLAVIIPAHKPHAGLIPAIDSVLAQSPNKVHLYLVATQEVLDSLPDNRLEQMTLVGAPENTSFPSMVNAGIEAVRENEVVEWVSILEYDDKLLPHAGRLFEQYSAHFTDTAVFAGLTLICEPGTRGGAEEDQPPALKQMANEAPWAPNIMETPGIADFNAMLRMNFVLLTSCFIKLELFDEIGVFKASMKNFSDYEFLLRVVYNGHEIRAIPKATHYHFANGEGLEQLKALDKEEGTWWVNAARKEYFFEFDRELEYAPTKGPETAGA